jgi:hypothetical protein
MLMQEDCPHPKCWRAIVLFGMPFSSAARKVFPPGEINLPVELLASRAQPRFFGFVGYPCLVRDPVHFPRFARII